MFEVEIILGRTTYRWTFPTEDAAVDFLSQVEISINNLENCTSKFADIHLLSEED